MPYDNETGHSYFKSDNDAEQWLSLYAPEAYYYPLPIDQQPGTIPIDAPMHDNSPFIPKDPCTQLPACLQHNEPHHPKAVCPTTSEDLPSTATLLLCDAGASVYKEGDVTRSTSKSWGTLIPGPRLRSPLKT